MFRCCYQNVQTRRLCLCPSKLTAINLFLLYAQTVFLHFLNESSINHIIIIFSILKICLFQFSFSQHLTMAHPRVFFLIRASIF